MFDRLARFCFRRRGLVLIAWLVALIGFSGVSGALGTGYSSQFSLPDSDARKGFDVLADHFGGFGGGGGSIVFRAEQGVMDPSVQEPMTEFFGEVAAIGGFGITSPYDPQGAQQIAAAGPEAGKIAFAQIDISEDITLEEALEFRDQINDLEPAIDGVEIRLGGQIFSEFEPPKAEFIGLGFAIVVLILSFGSVLAMGLPIGVALAGIGVGVAITGLVSRLITMPDFTATLAIMIGLGVGIDYALFIVTRFREQHRRGHSYEDAIAVALDTAGRAVTFAGITVVISLMGMLLMGLQFVRGLAIGASITVAVVLVASLTLLPALLGFAKHRVEVTRWRGLAAAALVAAALVFFGLSLPPVVSLVCVALAVVVLAAGFAVAPLRKEVPNRPPKPLRETVGYRWSRVIQHRPVDGGAHGRRPARRAHRSPCSVCAWASPTRATTRRAPTPARPTTSSAPASGPATTARSCSRRCCPKAPIRRRSHPCPPRCRRLRASCSSPRASRRRTARRSSGTSSRPRPAGRGHGTDLVKLLREEVVPAATQGTGLDVFVTGTVAANSDFSSFLAARSRCSSEPCCRSASSC
jgi:putative drug exporter of the RND superfamily